MALTISSGAADVDVDPAPRGAEIGKWTEEAVAAPAEVMEAEGKPAVLVTPVAAPGRDGSAAGIGTAEGSK